MSPWTLDPHLRRQHPETCSSTWSAQTHYLVTYQTEGMQWLWTEEKTRSFPKKAPIHDQDSWAWLLADGQIKYFTSLTMVLLWGSITRALPHHMFLYFYIVWIFNHLYYICNLTSGVFKDIPKTLRNTILVTQEYDACRIQEGTSETDSHFDYIPQSISFTKTFEKCSLTLTLDLLHQILHFNRFRGDSYAH